MEYIPKSRPHDSCGYESGSGLTLTRQKGGGRGLTQAAALLLLLQDSLLQASGPLAFLARAFLALASLALAALALAFI